MKAAAKSSAARSLACVFQTSPASVTPEADALFARLRAILEPYAGRLSVTADEPAHYCLAVDYSPRFKKGFPVAWVKISKAYVSYHFMPVYGHPELRQVLSKKLLARMQGKSCFNFKRPDEALFQELEQLTAAGFAAAKKSGFV